MEEQAPASRDAGEAEVKRTIGALAPPGGDHEVLMNEAIDRVCRTGRAVGGRSLAARERLCVDLYEEVVRRALGEGVGEEGVCDKLLVREQGVTKDQAFKAAALLGARMGQLREAMADETARVSGERVTDMDWKVRVVLASSTAGSMRQPLADLALYTTDADGRTRESVLELDREELDRLVASLTEMRAAMGRIPY